VVTFGRLAGACWFPAKLNSHEGVATVVGDAAPGVAMPAGYPHCTLCTPSAIYSAYAFIIP